MGFFLRNIILALGIVILLLGGIAVYVSGLSVHNLMLNRVFDERILAVETTGIALQNADEQTIQRLLRDNAQAPGVAFARLVDRRSKTILLSSEEGETGRVLENLPDIKSNQVVVFIEPRKEQPNVDLTYSVSPEIVLWVSLSRLYFSAPALSIAAQFGVILLILFTLLGALLFFLVRRYLVLPMRTLREVLLSVQEAGELKELPKNVGLGNVFAYFPTIAKRIQRAIEHDKVVSQMKSDFISTTAHQLRTPLSGINWALSSLLSNGENLTTEQKNIVGRALEKNKELVAIVGELLSAAGIEQGKVGYHKEEVDVYEEIKKTVTEEQELALKNKVTLRLDMAKETFSTVHVDRERVRWVIRNLIENAIRYSKPQGEIVVSLVEDVRELHVSVKDEGIGISEDAQKHIFEKFYRSSEARSKRNDGSGLGLYIAKNIINYHGGRIWFESVPGVGTTFAFTLPVAKSMRMVDNKSAEGGQNSPQKVPASVPDTNSLNKQDG